MRSVSSLLVVTSLVGFAILGCGGGSKPAPPPPAPVAPPPAAPVDPAGYFVWYNPSGTLFHSSADGSTWTAVAGMFPADLRNYTISIASDVGGRLYTGRSPSSLFHSEDGGKSWAAVTQSGTVPDGVDYRFCAGAADELYGVGSDGSGIYSSDAGQSWTIGRVQKVGAKGAGDGFTGGCAFSTTGELAVDGWYFDPPGAVTETSTDHGATFAPLARAAVNTSTDGLGFAGGSLFYAQHGGYTGAIVSRYSATTGIWTSTPELKGVPDREFANYAFATNGTQVVGWENPSKHAAGNTTSFVQISTDGGATFHSVPGPVAADPTPTTSDEYLAIGWSNGKTPAAMPAARPVAQAPEGHMAPPQGRVMPQPPGMGMGGHPQGGATSAPAATSAGNNAVLNGSPRAHPPANTSRPATDGNHKHNNKGK